MENKYKDINEAIEDLTIKHILALNNKEKENTELWCKLYAARDTYEILNMKYNRAIDIINKQAHYIEKLKRQLMNYKSFYAIKVGELNDN